MMTKDYSIGTRHRLLDKRSKKKPGFHHLYKVLTYVHTMHYRQAYSRKMEEEELLYYKGPNV
jgi:hypothetical protein